MSYFNFNGKFFKDTETVIGPDNRGLRYGDGLFETIKIINGKIDLEDEHFARLWKGMQLLQFELPKHFNPEKLVDEMLLLAKKNGHNQAARVRLNIFRGDGGLYDPKNLNPHYIIQTWALPLSNGQWNSNGLVLGCYTDAKKICDAFSNSKHNNYLPYVMAALYAKKKQWNDAVVLNQYGRVCDSTIANIFLIKEEKIYTPSLAEGCVAGVMRHKIIIELKAAGWDVFESEINLDDLKNAEEIFLSNSIYQIRWVQSFGNKQYQNKLTSKIFSALFQTI